MLRSFVLVLVFAGVAPVLRAQTLVSPAEYATVEGPRATDLPFSVASLRYQQADRSVQGGPRILLAMAFRRDGCITTSAAARVVELSIQLSDSTCALSTTFAANYQPNLTTVFPRTNVNFAAWTPPAACPAPFDNEIPFSTPFVYPGTSDLLFELQVFGNSHTTPYVADSAANLPCWDSCSSELSVGCLVPGRTNRMAHTFSMRNCGGGALTIDAILTEGPSSAPYLLQICPCPCPPLGGFCAPVHIAGTGCVPLTIGTTDPSGSAMSTVPVQLPIDPCLFGSLCSQVASVQGLSLYFSNGRCTKIPCNPRASACIRSVWAFNSSATVATASAASAVIVRFRL